MSVTTTEILTSVEISSETETIVTEVINTDTVTIVVEGPQGPKGDTGPQGPSGSGMPSEGLTGQVLAKKSDASFDLEWKSVVVDVSNLVSKTTTVNGKALSTNITLLTADISDSTDKRYLSEANLAKLSNTSGVNTGDQDLSGLVTKTTTVNGQALSSNVTLTTADVGDSLNKRYVTDSDLTKLSNTSGTNTGDQNIFSTFIVAGQSNCVADSASDSLTLIAGDKIEITTNSLTDSITIGTVGAGDVSGPSSAIDNALTRFDGTSGKIVQNSVATLSDAGNLDTVSATVDYLQIDVAATPPASAPGRVIYDDGEGTLDLGLKGGNVNLKIGEQQFLRVYNDSGFQLPFGKVVYISGAQGNRPAVKLAQSNSELTSKDTIGFTAETIPVASEGWVQTSGTLKGFNTSSFDGGDTVYLSPTTAGEFTKTKPVAPNHLLPLAFVTRVHASVGTLYLKIENGYELEELHDVKITGTPAAGSLIIRDATEGVWENATLTAGSHITVTNADAAVTIAVTGVGSANGIASLDSGGKVPANQLPSSLMDYRGVWNANTNSPSLADGVGSAGDVYRVSTAGTQNLGSGAISFEVGDYVIYNGTIWEKSDTTDAVASVNSKTGVVVLNPDDLDDTSTTHKFTSTSDISRLANTSGTNTGDQDLSGLVTKTTTVNGQALSSNVTLTTANISDSTNKRYVTDADLTKLSNTSGVNSGDQDLSGLVPNTRTVNGQALSADVTLTTANIADSTDKRYITDAQQAVLTNTSGTNSGDQNIFQRIAIAGNSDIVADTTSDTLTLVAGTNVTLTTNASTDSITINSAGGTNQYFNSYLGFGFKNALINSTFNVTQRIIPGSAISWTSGHPISANTDGNYNFDRWYMLCDGANKINITQETASLPVFGVQTGCRLTQVATSAANGKFGLAQIVEKANIPSFLGYVACLQAKLRVSNATRLSDIRLAVIGWTGTADTLTRDFISSWNASGVNPTLIANASYLNTPVNMSIPDVWQIDSGGRPVIYNIATGVPSNVNNLIVFIYSNTVGTTAGDFLTLADVQMEANDSSTNFENVPYDIQLMRAQRYYYGLYASGTSMAYCNTYAVTSIRHDGQFTFPVFMRVPPLLVTSAASTFAIATGGKTTLTSAPSGIRSYPAGIYLANVASTAAYTAGEGGLLVDNGTTGPLSYMLMNSEL